MDREYIRQRGIRNRRNYRIKVVVTMLLIITLIALCTIWVCKLIADSSRNVTPSGSNGTPQSTTQTTPSTPSNPNSNSENNPNVGTSDPTPTESVTQNDPTATSAPTNTATPTPDPVPLIAIDAGHGGDDSGTRRNGYFEADINIAIAKMVKEKLSALGYRVYMLREENETVDRELRPGMATEEGADLYVSIHQNAIDGNNNATQGTEVWYNEKMNSENLALATVMADEITKLTGSRNRGTKVGNGLIVLKTLDIPACLIECGFVSSEDELARLVSADYQEKIADGIVNAIVSFMPLP